MAKQDPAADLAAKLLQTLQQQRDRGADAYPLTVSQLAALADPQAAPELVTKALGKKPYAAQLVRASKKHADSPVALAEDSDLLAASPLLLEFALSLLCSAEKPVHPLDKVVAKVDKSLQPAFKAALQKQIAEGSLPPTAGTLTLKGKTLLFLKKYPPPPSPAGELAQKLLETLQARKTQGGSRYPVTLDELKKLTEPTVKAALFKQALAQDVFANQVLRPVPARTDAPVVLIGDRDLLASSAALLEYLLDGTTTAKKPLATISHLKRHLLLELQQPFEEAVSAHLARRSLPATVGVLSTGEEPELYLIGQAPASWVLAQKLLGALKAQQRQGPDAYPARLSRLAQLADPEALPEQVRKALADKTLKQLVVVASAGQPDSPVILADDRDLLASSPTLLFHVLGSARSPDNQAVPLANLKKQLDKSLRYTFEATLEKQLETASLPAGVGSLRIKKVPFLFLLQDAQGTGTAPLAEPARTVAPAAPPAVDFGRLFDEAFAQLDRQRGGHNLVSLVGLRQAVPVERALFDSELNHLRRAGRYTLSAAEGRHGITTEEREAGILEDGSLLLFVSRRQT